MSFHRIAALLLAACLSLSQSRLSVTQLQQFIESSIRLGHPDKQVAEYIRKLTVRERLTAGAVEDMVAAGAGPRTRNALMALVESSAGLPLPPKSAAKPVAAAPLPAPSRADQNAVLQSVRDYAMNYSKQLPDFICTQVTRRYVDPSGLEFWRQADTVTAQLTYFEQKENYKVILVNSRPVELGVDELGGATSTGEFGTMLREVFDPASGTAFAWDRWATLRGHRSHVFRYRVPRENSKWSILYEKTDRYVPGYTGLIYVDDDTKQVLRLTLDAVDIPVTFPVQQATTTLDYDYVKIAEREFLLPLRAVIRMRESKTLVKNEVEFRLYRKFGAGVEIKFDLETPPPLPEEQTQEKPPA